MFALSDETAALIRYLQQHEKGALVRYPELSRIAGIKVTGTTAKLIHARRILLNKHAQAWACVKPNIGLRRLEDREIAETLDTWFVAGARRKLKRGGRHADVVETEQLNAQEQAAFAVACIQRELGLSSLSKATHGKIAKMARGTSNDMPSFTAIEWAISLSPKGKKATA